MEISAINPFVRAAEEIVGVLPAAPAHHQLVFAPVLPDGKPIPQPIGQVVDHVPVQRADGLAADAEDLAIEPAHTP